jgi:hypothetical protein
VFGGSDATLSAEGADLRGRARTLSPALWVRHHALNIKTKRIDAKRIQTAFILRQLKRLGQRRKMSSRLCYTDIEMITHGNYNASAMRYSLRVFFQVGSTGRVLESLNSSPNA